MSREEYSKREHTNRIQSVRKIKRKNYIGKGNRISEQLRGYCNGLMNIEPIYKIIGMEEEKVSLKKLERKKNRLR